jgi:16S rRNA pseudouridine516 synthase
MRLDKFVCKSTALTKSEALKVIHAGAVSVNGRPIINEAAQVHENNQICLNKTPLVARAFRYLLMHKPVDTICSNIDERYPSLFNHIDIENKTELHIAGRLDADTTGLVLITDDGRWSYNITIPTKQCTKVYRVGLTRPLCDDVPAAFLQGVQLQGEDRLTLPAIVDVVSPTEVLLTITEGKFHQVKRMFAAVGNRVKTLHREQIGDVRLDVNSGEWRYLSEEEIASFNVEE